MPKPKRRTYRKFRPNRPTEDNGREQQEIERAARALAATLGPSDLESECANRAVRLDEADRAAQMDPSPANLASFRHAQREFKAAEAARRLGPISTEG